MRQRRYAVVRLASLVLVSCSMISGADDLSVGEEETGPASSDGGDASPEPPRPDGDAPDVTDDGALVDGGDSGSCDEPGLVARFRFDEGAGTKTFDCTSNAVEGLLENSGWTPGKTGSALLLDGGWASFGDSPKLRVGGGPFTLAAWINQRVNTSGTAYIVGKTSNNATRGWRIAEQSGLSFSVSRDDAATTLTGGTIPTGAWSHVAAVFKPQAALEIFVDGKRVARREAGVPAEVPDLGDPLRVGARADGLYPFVGAIDEVRVYARALDEADIAKLAAP